jgi:hypothetical protein
VQRTSSDLRLNPHLHLVVLDGAWHEQGAELAWQALGHLKTSEGQCVSYVERHRDRNDGDGRDDHQDGEHGEDREGDRQGRDNGKDEKGRNGPR